MGLGLLWRSFQIPRGCVLESLSSCVVKWRGFECSMLQLASPRASSAAAAGLGRHERARPAGASRRGRRGRAARVGGDSAAGGAAGGGGRRVLTERTEEARTGVGSLRPPFSEGRDEPASEGNILLWSQPNLLLFHPNNRGDGSAPTWLVPLLNQTDGKKIEGTRD